MYAVIAANAPDLDAGPYLAQLQAADLLVAADGGALPLLRLGCTPHLVIGDMDSLDQAAIEVLSAQGVALRRFRRDKDETDLELALLHAAHAGATTIDIIGALGGRWDHTLANVALLALPELRGRQVRLLADRQTLFLVRDAATLDGQAGDTISLIPLTSVVRGVTTRGLARAELLAPGHPLHDAVLSFSHARGVSNVLLEPPGHVGLHEGLLLVVHHDDAGTHQWRGGS